MKMFSICVLPAVVAGHGIALPVSEDKEDVFKAGEHAVKLVGEVVEKCAKEAFECLPAATQGWEAGARCLIEKFESIEHEECLDEIEHMARHLPLALYSQNNNIIDDGEIPPFGDFGKRVNRGCDLQKDVLPYVWSYHLHLQWDFIGCKDCKETALEFADKMLAEFQPDAKMCRRMAFLTDLWNTDSIPRNESENHHFADICKMATLPPGGPFIHAEKGFTVSTTMFHKMLPWLMANRPANDELYMLVHPNTGCQYNDLRHWSLWVSKSLGMDYDILKGCVWASCEDQVLGCIAFNHLRKDQGYNTCFSPPTAYAIDCTIELGAGNTSTEVCRKELKAPPAIV